MVEIDAYAADCRVYGQVEFGQGRVSDQLNRTSELLIRDARLEGLADGHVVAMPELTIARNELCAVVVSGPRGDAARRLHTQTTRVEVEVGPYRIEGRVHGTSTSEPLGWVLRQAAWVALTEARVTYRCGAGDVSEEMATLLVNRHLMRSFRAVEEAGLDLPWEAPRAPKTAAPGAIGSAGTPRERARPRGDETDPPAPSKPIA
ncbi:MAG: hypothetical protein ABSA21_14100 [Candidatus Limnocylindrales bacterium]|jgi:hypothetical protein